MIALSKRIPIHPGEILLEEFLRPLGMTQRAFAKHIGVSLQRLNGIIHGKRGVMPDTALRLAQAFGNSPEFWLSMQSAWDLANTERPRIKKLTLTSRPPAVRTAA